MARIDARVYMGTCRIEPPGYLDAGATSVGQRSGEPPAMVLGVAGTVLPQAVALVGRRAVKGARCLAPCVVGVDVIDDDL